MAQVNHLQVVLDFIKRYHVLPQDVVDSCIALRQSKLCDTGYYVHGDVFENNYAISAGDSPDLAFDALTQDCGGDELDPDCMVDLNEWLGVTTWEQK